MGPTVQKGCKGSWRKPPQTRIVPQASCPRFDSRPRSCVGYAETNHALGATCHGRQPFAITRLVCCDRKCALQKARLVLSWRRVCFAIVSHVVYQFEKTEPRLKSGLASPSLPID